MRREEWVTVQGPVKKQQPDGMSHRGLGRGEVDCKEQFNVIPPFLVVQHMRDAALWL